MVYNWLINNQLFTPRKNCLLCLQRLSPSAESSTLMPTPLCRHCERRLPRIDNPCYRCGLPIPAVQTEAIDMAICGACIASSPLQYRSISPFAYLFPVPELVAAIKYHRQLQYLGTLAHCFAAHAIYRYQNDVLPDLIVPVPLHPNRQFTRGFNQAELFATQIGKQLQIQCAGHFVIRKRNTAPQMALKISDRRKNMSRAFGLTAKAAELQGRHVAIFDDVFTTGATAESIAKLLLKADCRRVDIWSIARTPKPD